MQIRLFHPAPVLCVPALLAALFVGGCEIGVTEQAKIGGVEGVLTKADIVRFAGPEPTLQ